MSLRNNINRAKRVLAWTKEIAQNDFAGTASGVGSSHDSDTFMGLLRPGKSRPRKTKRLLADPGTEYSGYGAGHA